LNHETVKVHRQDEQGMAYQIKLEINVIDKFS
jgi:hypothetical protein